MYEAGVLGNVRTGLVVRVCDEWAMWARHFLTTTVEACMAIYVNNIVDPRNQEESIRKAEEAEICMETRQELFSSVSLH